MKLLVLFFTAFFCLCVLPVPAYADDYVYLQAQTNGIYVYEDADFLKPVFELPVTYFVKTTRGEEESARAFLYDSSGTPLIDGYVKRSQLSSVDDSVTEPYLNLEITSANPLQIFQDAKMQTVLRNVFSGRTFTYFGRANLYGSELYYVRYENTFGYAEAVNFSPFDVPENEYEKRKPETVKESTEKSSGMNALKIAIIVLVSLASLCVFVSFFVKPKKKDKNASVP